MSIILVLSVRFVVLWVARVDEVGQRERWEILMVEGEEWVIAVKWVSKFLRRDWEKGTLEEIGILGFSVAEKSLFW